MVFADDVDHLEDERLSQSQARESELGVIDGVEDRCVAHAICGRPLSVQNLVDRADESLRQRRLHEDDRILRHGAVVEREEAPVLSQPAPHLLEARHGVYHVVLFEKSNLTKGGFLRQLLKKKEAPQEPRSEQVCDLFVERTEVEL